MRWRYIDSHMSVVRRHYQKVYFCLGEQRQWQHQQQQQQKYEWLLLWCGLRLCVCSKAHYAHFPRSIHSVWYNSSIVQHTFDVFCAQPYSLLDHLACSVPNENLLCFYFAYAPKKKAQPFHGLFAVNRYSKPSFAYFLHGFIISSHTCTVLFGDKSTFTIIT